MAEIIALSSLAAAVLVLIALSIIDLRHFILPDKLVLTFLVLALAFHYATHFLFLDPADMARGAITGGGFLYAVRFAANSIYKDDTLGLGDVKLMAAAGAWLGVEGVLIAIIAGAAAGLLHGMGIATWRAHKTKTRIKLLKLSLPAGPGFAVGILIAALLQFHELPAILGS